MKVGCTLGCLTASNMTSLHEFQSAQPKFSKIWARQHRCINVTTTKKQATTTLPLSGFLSLHGGWVRSSPSLAQPTERTQSFGYCLASLPRQSCLCLPLQLSLLWQGGGFPTSTLVLYHRLFDWQLQCGTIPDGLNEDCVSRGCGWGRKIYKKRCAGSVTWP